MNVEDAEKGSTRVVRLRMEQLFAILQNNDFLCLNQSVFFLFLKYNATVNTNQRSGTGNPLVSIAQ